MLVAVYGSLRKGFGNHRLLDTKEATYMGMFETAPIYVLKSLSAFPGLLKHGHTSVVMEVYRVTQAVANRIDTLEGYSGPDHDLNMYNKETIKTPYGEASIYFYADEERADHYETCVTGDWKEYLTQKKINQDA